MKVTVSSEGRVPSGTSAIVAALVETEKGPVLSMPGDQLLGKDLVRALRSLGVTGRRGERVTLHPPDGRPAREVLAVGLGPEGEIDPEALRRLGGVAGTAARDQAHLRSVSVIVPSGVPSLSGPDAARFVAEGVLLGAYRFDELRGELATGSAAPRPGAPAPVTLLGEGGKAALTRALRTAEHVAGGVNLARQIGDRPPNLLGPVELAELARTEGRAAGLRVTVLDETAIAKKKLGALLAVAVGSSRPARFVILEHRPPRVAKKVRPLVFVGKAITFDTGGISIKPREAMDLMKFDLGGGAAVIGAMTALARLGADRPVVGLVPIAENMPGGSATRPGDVVRSASGITIEILNTDAEGRLILADALHLACGYDPSLIVDVATLTGACAIALGTNILAGLFTRTEGLDAAVIEAGRAAGERYWRLPIEDEHVELMKGEVGDLRNSGGGAGGASLAAAFLSRFVGETPWVHLDIAPTANTGTAGDYQRKGATGFGVRTLVELAARHPR
jgi:leucyl aminopeptidase